MNEVYVTLCLPIGPGPAGGWPVRIFGPPSASNKSDDPFHVAASMAANGIATIAINVAGYGFGPLSTLTGSQPAAAPVTLPAGGRSVDQNGDGIIGGTEGQFAAAPRHILGQTHPLRDAAADLIQPPLGMQVGVELHRQRSPRLPPSRTSHPL